MIVKPISGAALAAAALTLAVSGAVTMTPASAAAKVMCYGVNACKGQGACKAAGHSCAGMNSCKGQAWIWSSASNCKTWGGKEL